MHAGAGTPTWAPTAPNSATAASSAGAIAAAVLIELELRVTSAAGDRRGPGRAPGDRAERELAARAVSPAT